MVRWAFAFTARLSDRTIIRLPTNILYPKAWVDQWFYETLLAQDCARVISAAEGFCQRNMFPGLRALYQLYGRQRKKTRPRVFRLSVETKQNSFEADVSIKDFPFMTVFPKLASPGMKSFKNISECAFPDFRNNREALWLWEYAENRQRAARLIERFGAIRVGSPLVMRPNDFCRLLAKIGYAMVVAIFGYEALEPLLTDYIRAPIDADLGQLLYYVGQAYHDDGTEVKGTEAHFEPKATEEKAYKILTYDINRSDTNEWFAACQIQLFSHLGAPVYEVIAARFKLNHAPTVAAAQRL